MATSKLCDSCKSAAPNLYCRADSAFLCVSCDARVHEANKLASRHARVWMCEVCEQAPAHVTCKADAAALCVTCDRDIHSANPLARRHERVPVVPFYDPVPSADGFVEEDEAEAASWLLPAAAKPDPYACSFPDMVDPFLDLDYVDAKQEEVEEEEDPSGDNNSSGTADGVVPVQSQLNPHQLFTNHGSRFELDFSSPLGASKPLTFPTYNFHSTPCLSHSVSSSSMEVGVVPEGEIYSSGGQQMGAEQAKEAVAVALSGVDREARVLRYREKRKNRKFEKTIRYASRKAYAETRPRIKGRFAKRTDLDHNHNHDHDHDHDHLVDHRSSHLLGFGVVPSY